MAVVFCILEKYRSSILHYKIRFRDVFHYEKKDNYMSVAFCITNLMWQWCESLIIII